MLATTFSALLHGLTALQITIEIALTPGLPSLQIVGLPSQTIAESKERITAALASCGIKPKAQRTVVNLAPADIRKNSSAFELAIAAGLLQLYGKIPPIPTDTLLLGELSLVGELKAITGVLPLVMGAKQLGFKRVYVPAANSTEASLVPGITCVPIESLTHFIALQTGTDSHPNDALKVLDFTKEESSTAIPNRTGSVLLEEIVGQQRAKKALEIAAAGGHNLYLVGPPGTGKSLLAEALNQLLPDLSEPEMLEVYSLHSLVQPLQPAAFTLNRPFRKIHHTVSQVGLVGGGQRLTPGEISLAHRGVLFMDELPEFPRQILESLRQPLETKTITISRASGTVQYPANCMLVAAANPCPCGYKGSQKKACTCSEFHQQQYANRISGPLLDRIDLKVWVGEVSLRQIGHTLLNSSTAAAIDQAETTAAIKARVLHARQRQAKRFATTPHLTTNAEMSSQDIKQYCFLEPAARYALINYAEEHMVSARQYVKMVKVAQTVADLEGTEKITLAQVRLVQQLQYL